MQLNLFLEPSVKPLSLPEGVIELSNEADPLELDLSAVQGIRLSFPKFTDGRAFSQAVMLRKRRGFKGDICATGEVLIDQVIQIARTGFSSAELRADQDIEHAKKLLTHFKGFYQGDVINPAPAFAR
jgi:uncharacterized protein (DUF934 family)